MWLILYDSVMSVPANRLVRSFTNLRLVTSVMTNNQICAAKCRHERIFTSLFPKKSIWSGFCITLSGPRPEDAITDLTATSFLNITTLSIAVKIASWITSLTAATTVVPISLLFLSITFLSLTSVKINWISSTGSMPSISFVRIKLWASFISFFRLLLPKSQPFKFLSEWLMSFIFCYFFRRVETMFATTTELAQILMVISFKRIESTKQNN